VLPGQGIKQRVAKVLPLVKSGVWGCVQVREKWSTEEDAHRRPGHHWLREFGDAGNDTSCVKEFNLSHTLLQRRPYARDQEVVQQSGGG
jgi:hypothetical protein